MNAELDLAWPGDYLEIRDGMSGSAPLIKTFTTKLNLNERWASSGNHLWIRFISDNDTVATGFSLQWKFTNKPKGKNTESHLLQFST